MSIIIDSVVVRHIFDEDGDLSYLTQDYEDCTPEEAARYKAEDAKRLADYYRGEWHNLGIRAEATILIPSSHNPLHQTRQRITSGGQWGIESDSEDGYFEEVAEEELGDLRHQLEALGVDLTTWPDSITTIEL